MRWRPNIWCVEWMSISRCRGARSPDLLRRSCGMILTHAPSMYAFHGATLVTRHVA